MQPRTAKTRSPKRTSHGGVIWDKPAGSFRGRRGARESHDVRQCRPWKLLFVGPSNCHRSQAAEAFCRAMIASHCLNIKVTSAGVTPNGIDPLTLRRLQVADAILAMDASIVSALAAEYGLEPSRIICLHIPDIYKRADRELQMALEASLRGYLMALARLSHKKASLSSTYAARMSRGTAQAS